MEREDAARLCGLQGRLQFGRWAITDELDDSRRDRQPRPFAPRSSSCRACPLWENATQTVFGEGPSDAEIMLVGEQPGDREDLAGRPFVGPVACSSRSERPRRKASQGVLFRSKARGEVLELASGLRVLITVHPSSLLRLRDEKDKREAYDALVQDLRSIAQIIGREAGLARPNRMVSTG
jgi:uracil-DNA glycosylase